MLGGPKQDICQKWLSRGREVSMVSGMSEAVSRKLTGRERLKEELEGQPSQVCGRG